MGDQRSDRRFSTLTIFAAVAAAAVAVAALAHERGASTTASPRIEADRTVIRQFAMFLKGWTSVPVTAEATRDR
jgi:hypothetical protein